MPDLRDTASTASTAPGGPVPARTAPPRRTGARAAVADALAVAGYAAGWAVAGRVPTPVLARLSDLGADLTVRRDGTGVRRLRAHLARARPAATPAELDALVTAGMRSYARYWREAFTLPRLDPAAVHAAMHPHSDGVAAALAAARPDRGVVFALPHSGNWDLAGLYLLRELDRMGLDPVLTTVAQRLRPDAVFRRFLAYRRALGFEVVTADEPRAAHRALTGRLRRGGVVCLVADRDLAGTGTGVTFLGGPARLPSGPARLARLTGAALYPAYPYFTDDAWGVEVGPAVAVPDRAAEPHAVQRLADHFGDMIARRPQDWHMLQPIGDG
ncbi:phosphatidylinositol mannoside acyltransferase [Pseudonocardia spirodelae]|uniref:Phosphatidylinositol mannoside acyltransferase n=1 Tax=Pseudonocardia spirodelae TaxID=3133431 RepID=A0ABU8T112_9PSEU